MQTTTANQGWHTAQWGTWGILETIVKCLALLAGIIALLMQLPGAYMIGGNPHLAAFIVLVLATLASILQVTIRLKQRETLSMAFAVFNLIGHIALLITLAHVPHHRLWPVLFGALYVVGGLVKIQFLRVTGYTEEGADSAGMIRTTGIITGIYVLFTLFMMPA